MVVLRLASVLSIGLGLFLLSAIHVSAQPLVPSSPTGTLTDGINISINPEEPLPANGTVSISTEGVTDTDMNIIPPEGVTVVIENDTVTVTNQTVDIEMADEDEDGAETEEDEETEGNGTGGGGDEGGDEGGDDGDEGVDDEGGDDGDEGDDDEGGEGGGPAVPF
ncbi:MAG TPA: hypothetical protein VFR94_24325 [Nitrososphaeraceae archaeon]|nr:hypothetical protein [Nitrososphaeraceae archaeon]